MIHRYFVVCLVGVWQSNFEPVVCVCTVRPAWCLSYKRPESINVMLCVNPRRSESLFFPSSWTPRDPYSYERNLFWNTRKTFTARTPLPRAEEWMQLILSAYHCITGKCQPLLQDSLGSCPNVCTAVTSDHSPPSSGLLLTIWRLTTTLVAVPHC